jgi:hypothetical protein
MSVCIHRAIWMLTVLFRYVLQYEQYAYVRESSILAVGTYIFFILNT